MLVRRVSMGCFGGAGLVLALLLVPVTALFAFSSGGARALQQGAALIFEPAKYQGTELERSRVADMSEIERLEAAVELLEDARRAAVTEAEAEKVDGFLYRAHNRLYLRLKDAGRPDEALGHIEKAIELKDDDAALHWNFGCGAYDAGRYDDAARAYERARELARKNDDARMADMAHRRLIETHMKQGMGGDGSGFDYALREVEQLLYDAPGDFVLHVLKGKILYFMARYDDAVRAWDEARNHGTLPDNLEEMYRTAKTSKKVAEQGAEAVGDVFVVRVGPGFGPGLAERFLALFSEAWIEVGNRFDLRPDTKIQVSVLADADYQVSNAKWSAGTQQYNKIDIRLRPGASDAVYRSTIFHEYAHFLAYLTADMKAIPRWFNEGLAMSSEPDAMEKYRRFYKILVRAYHGGSHKSLPALDDFGSLEGGQIDVAYATSFYATRYFLNRHGGMATAKAILRRIGEGIPFERAFEERTRVSLAEFDGAFWARVDERLKRHLARKRREQGPAVTDVNRR